MPDTGVCETIQWRLLAPKVHAPLLINETLVMEYCLMKVPSPRTLQEQAGAGIELVSPVPQSLVGRTIDLKTPFLVRAVATGTDDPWYTLSMSTARFKETFDRDQS